MAAVQGNTFICSWPPLLSANSDFVYHGAEIASLALAVGCVVLMSTKFKSTYQQDVDSFGALHVPTEWGTLYIFVPCLLLAMVRGFLRRLDFRDVERVELVCFLCVPSPMVFSLSLFFSLSVYVLSVRLSLSLPLSICGMLFRSLTLDLVVVLNSCIHKSVFR